MFLDKFYDESAYCVGYCVRKSLLMGLSEGLNLLALVVVPRVAVVVGQYLQTRSKKKDEQYKIFKELLRSRVFGLDGAQVCG